MPNGIVDRRRLLQALLLVSVGTAGATPADAEIRVFSHGDSSALREILQALGRRYPRALIYMPDEAPAIKGPSINLAIGPAALRSVLDARRDGPVIALFTSSQAYRQVVADHRPVGSTAPVSAIHAEAPPHHQMELIARIYRRRVSVGVMLSDATAFMASAIQEAAGRAGLDVVLERTSKDAKFSDALFRLKGAQVVLLIPDSSLYTPENVRNLLEATYRRNQAVIGFSLSLVNAGALAAAYSSTEDVLAQLDELMGQLGAGQVPQVHYPRYWRVAFNESVARSLNIALDEAVRLLGQRPGG